MTTIFKIIRLANNLRNIMLMSANSQKKYFEKSYYVLNLFDQKHIDVLKYSKK